MSFALQCLLAVPTTRRFVCVRERDPSGALLSQRLRTYVHPAEHSMQCTVVEAIRATMGNPVFFTPPTLPTGNNSSSVFMDAGDDRCNPSFDLYEEALSLSPSREVAYFLSLGAGRPSTIDLTPPRGIMHQPRLPPSCMAAMHHLATRCDALAESFLRENDELEPVYYRFNHDQGSLDGKMAQWEQVGVLKEFLKPYSLSVDNVTWALEAKMMDQREYELAFRRGTLQCCTCLCINSYFSSPFDALHVLHLGNMPVPYERAPRPGMPDLNQRVSFDACTQPSSSRSATDVIALVRPRAKKEGNLLFNVR